MNTKTNQTDLLDPTAKNDLPDDEREVLEDASRAGKTLESTVAGRSGEHLTDERDTGGIVEQTVNSKAVAGFGQPGGDTDISGGAANLDETTDAPVEQNEYNR